MSQISALIQKTQEIFLPSPPCSVSHSVVPDSLQPCGLNNPPESSVHGLIQARILNWVAIPFFRGSSQLCLYLGLLH